MEKVIDITAKRDGFRRAGMAHSEATTTYPLSKFTKVQLALLQNEPMLVVAIRNADEQAGTAEDSPLVLDLRKQITTLTEQLGEANDFLTSERQKNSELTTRLSDEQTKYNSILDLHEDYRTESTKLLEGERQKASELATELESERQKVADLTAKLEAVNKKGK